MLELRKFLVKRAQKSFFLKRNEKKLNYLILSKLHETFKIAHFLKKLLNSSLWEKVWKSFRKLLKALLVETQHSGGENEKWRYYWRIKIYFLWVLRKILSLEINEKCTNFPKSSNCINCCTLFLISSHLKLFLNIVHFNWYNPLINPSAGLWLLWFFPNQPSWLKLTRLFNLTYGKS
jgi:hypothetical protein